MKHRYRFGKFVLICDQSVEGVERAPAGLINGWTVKFDTSQGQLAGSSKAIEIWRDPNDVLSVWQSREEFVVRFRELADFLIKPSGQSIEIYPHAGSSSETINHLLFDQVLPRVLAHVEGMVLHAAGVLVGEQAVVFLGETGHGKSTLANSFLQAGFSLLTDDALLVDLTVDKPTVQALYPCIRLWPESFEGLYEEGPQTAPMAHYSTKQRVLLDQSENITVEPQMIGAAFVLSMGDSQHPVQITPLGQQAACMEFIKNSFQLAPNDPAIAKAIFEQSIELANKVSVFELIYPEGYQHLPETRSAVQRQLADQLNVAGLKQ